MSKKDGILDLPIKKEWFDKIRSGEKTHEYRRVCSHWNRALGIIRIPHIDGTIKEHYQVNKVRLRCGQTAKSTDKEKTMHFEIKSISYVEDGTKTDLKYQEPVFDIELGRRIF